ncbi:MAG: isoprenoid biosynthesis glyoxalase ElbB [Schleiferiaceae bacterium]|nr:isoprenoid biosynthesis glyoxalase ElbB [Schleiferiaceae bacterium]
MGKKLAVLLHGSGVYDGTEIQEAVLTLLAIANAGHQYECFAPNKKQLHVINHLNGEVMDEERNVLVESARIARGEIKDASQLNIHDFDGLVLPGGFGTAKNFTTWALKGPESDIDPIIKNIIISAVVEKRPIVALCMSPTTIAKALEGTSYTASLSVGTTKEKSPYDIAGIHSGMQAVGAKPQEVLASEIAFDSELKIISAPCYMMEASIGDVAKNIAQAIAQLDHC